MQDYRCEICGKKFTAHNFRKRRFCSVKCRGRYRTKIGRLSSICFNCQKEFSHYKYEKRIYCSHKCANARGPAGKGGRIISCGYILIWQPHHPFADRRGYVSEHRLVMEKKIGIFLEKGEVVHHKNGNRADNRVENLQLFRNHSEHMKKHGFNRGVKHWGANDTYVVK